MESIELTQEECNVLKTYIDTESGRKLLLKLANEELNLNAESYSKKATSEQQVHNSNRGAGIYWVRTLVQDLISPPKPSLKK